MEPFMRTGPTLKNTVLSRAEGNELLGNMEARWGESDGWETHTHTAATRFNVSWQNASGQKRIMETSHSDQTTM